MRTIIALFSDYTFFIVASGCAFFGVVSGALGCFLVLRRQSLLGDGISHAALPGVTLICLLTGRSESEFLQFGAFVSGFAASYIVLGLVKHSRAKPDRALALTTSVFSGLGLVLLTLLQKLPGANHAVIKTFIYGQASALQRHDVIVISGGGAVVLFIVFLFGKELKLLAFDAEFTQSIGLKTGHLNLLLQLLTVSTIIIGLQAVGALLMSAMLISPATAARQWTDRFSVMVLLASVFGAVSGITGVLFSSFASGIPTGPVIVTVSCVITVFSLLFAPSRGILVRIIKRRSHSRRAFDERGL